LCNKLREWANSLTSGVDWSDWFDLVGSTGQKLLIASNLGRAILYCGSGRVLGRAMLGDRGVRGSECGARMTWIASVAKNEFP
jgi:hypothetical protein